MKYVFSISIFQITILKNCHGKINQR